MCQRVPAMVHGRHTKARDVPRHVWEQSLRGKSPAFVVARLAASNLRNVLPHTHIDNIFHDTYRPFSDNSPVSLLRYYRILYCFQGYVSAPPNRFGISSNLAFPCPPVLWLGLDGQRRTSYTRLCQGCHHDLDRPLRNGGPCRRSSGIFSSR